MNLSRVDAKLSDRYRKNMQDEEFLAHLNDLLADDERSSYCDCDEAFPTLNIVGAPRSGTTLVTQLVASCLNVGYINNLIAAFWRAPCTGIRLSRKLMPAGLRSTFHSEFGRTEGIHEPHEFGYFWASMLGYREMREPDEASRRGIDWSWFAKVMNNMTMAFDAPIVFKSFMFGFYTAEVQAVLPRTCFVFVRRDPVENALSILKMRRQYSGDEAAWASLMPYEYSWLRNESIAMQVAGQVLYCQEAYRRAMARVNGRNWIEVTLSDICADPLGLLESVRMLLRNNGAHVSLIADAPTRFDPSSPVRGSAAERAGVKAAVERLQELISGSV